MYEKEQLKKLELISKIIKVKKTDKLLDIGCGTAISTNYFKCLSIGIDPSFNMLKLGKGNRVNAFAEYLPFKDKSFDIILAVTSIHNFSNINKAINEIKRVSNDNARIVITLLRKSNKFDEIKSKLLNNFKFKQMEEEKDVILFR